MAGLLELLFLVAFGCSVKGTTSRVTSFANSLEKLDIDGKTPAFSVQHTTFRGRDRCCNSSQASVRPKEHGVHVQEEAVAAWLASVGSDSFPAPFSRCQFRI